MSKFVKLFESTLQRYTRAGFLVGDLVKFKENALKDEFFKTQGEDIKKKVQDLIASDLNIRIKNIKPKFPSVQGAGNTDYTGSDFLVDVAQELMPGKTTAAVTIPVNILTFIDPYPNLPPVANSLKYDNKIKIKPEVIKSEENEQVMFYTPRPTTHHSDFAKSKSDEGDRELLNKNIKIPAKTAEGQKDPAKYTARYLPKK